MQSAPFGFYYDKQICHICQIWVTDIQCNIYESLKSQSFKQWDLAQSARHENKKWTLQTVLGLRVQVLLDLSFLLYFFCSNTILEDLTEWCIYGKPQLCFSLWIIYSTPERAELKLHFDSTKILPKKFTTCASNLAQILKRSFSRKSSSNSSFPSTQNVMGYTVFFPIDTSVSGS